MSGLKTFRNETRARVGQEPFGDAGARADRLARLQNY